MPFLPRRREPRRPIVGPLFAYDLVASTRRGQHLGLRVLIGVLLLGVLYCMYALELQADPLANPFEARPNVDQRAMAAFANGFAVWCIVVQMLVVLMVTPIVVADAVAREKERRALDFLFVTDLTDREIVFGKLGSRLTYLVGVLLTGMPVVGLTALFGGVSPMLFVGGYSVIFSTVLGLTALCLCCSVLSKTSVQATTRAYCVAFGYLLFAPCIVGMMRGDEGFLIAAGAFSFANAMVAVFAIGTSLTELRPRALALTYAVPPVADVLPVADRPRPSARPSAQGRKPLPDDDGVPFVRPAPVVRRPIEVWQPPALPPPPLPPIDEDRPLLWKEVCLHSFTRGRLGPATPGLIGALVVAALCLALLLLAAVTNPRSGRADVASIGQVVVRVVTIPVGCILGLAAILHAVNGIVRERERDTLDGLLVLPVDRVAILEAKWLGGLYDLRALFVILGLVWLFGLLSGGLHPVGLVWLVACFAAPIEFVASLGIWLSAINRTSLRANLIAALCLLLILVGPWIVSNYVELAFPQLAYGNDLSSRAFTALMPPAAWYQSVVTWEEYAKLPAYTGDMLLGGALVYAIGAWLLWRLTVRRMRWVPGKL